jgi:hypothetical protein
LRTGRHQLGQPVSARATAHPTMAAIRPVRFLGITVVKASGKTHGCRE